MTFLALEATVEPFRLLETAPLYFARRMVLICSSFSLARLISSFTVLLPDGVFRSPLFRLCWPSPPVLRGLLLVAA